MSEHDLKYCRFCAEQKLGGNIFDLTEFSLRNRIQDKISLLHGNLIDLTVDNALPKTICSLCNNELDNAYEFLLKTQRSQNVLASLLGCEPKYGPDIPTKLPVELINNDDDVKSIKQEEDGVYKEYPVIQDVKSYIKIEQAECESCDRISEAGSDNVVSVQESESSSLSDDDTIPSYCGIPIFVDKSEAQQKVDDEKDKSETEQKHDDDVSWTSYPWACKHCNEKCPDIYLLREHTKRMHTLCSAFKCADCDIHSFNIFEDFVEHAKEHRQLLKKYCEYCNTKLSTSDRNAHMNKHKSKDTICKLCGKIFSNSQYLKEHRSKYRPSAQRASSKGKKKRPIRVYVVPNWEIEKLEDKSWTGYPWSCQLCDGVFTSAEEIRLHTKNAHEKCFVAKCVDCLEIKEGFRVFTSHVRKHRPHLKSYCHYCNQIITDNETEHVSQHFAQSQKLCEGCGEIFLSKTDFLEHLKTYKPDKSRDLNYLKREYPVSVADRTCLVCDKVCQSLNSLRAHQYKHTERKRDYTCERCGKMFFTKGTLISHYTIHQETKPETCKICKNNYKNMKQLRKHVLTHSEEKPFKCDICQRTFRLKSQMVQHSIIHTNNMPYQCEYCDKTFRHRNNWKIHNHQHTGVRPYCCSDCGMDFSNWANCNKHMKRKHGTTLATSVRTSKGKMPLNPKSLKPKKVKHSKMVKEWTEQILAKNKRGKKTEKESGSGDATVCSSEKL